MICATCGIEDDELDSGLCGWCACDKRNAERRALAASTGYSVHIDGITGPGDIDPATKAALDKMAGLLRKKELIRTGNAGVDANCVIVDMRENPNAVRLPPHNGENPLK